jgi:ABC-2 type transport system permease protein
MLWYKGWLETRFRLAFALGIWSLITIFQYSHRSAAQASNPKGAILGLITISVPFLVVIVCGMLAGAGIATQPSVVATKGLHGSTLFTLSLPVSRVRLLAVRAGVGWLAATAALAILCAEMWFVSPSLRAIATGAEMFQYVGIVIACASAIYFLAVLLATFLDDQWRVWGTMILSGGLWWLSVHSYIPASADIFRAIGKNSSLIAHTIPWTAMATSIGLAAILFFAALKIAQAREY